MAAPNPLPLVSAAAVAGNGWQENWLRPVVPRDEPKDHGSDGVLQWRLDRLVALKRYPRWDTLETQARFFKDECRAKYPQLWEQLRNPGERSIDNLTANICDFYERPSKAGRVIDRRIDFAKQVYDHCAPAPALPKVLQPVVNAPWASAMGAAAWAYAWVLSKLPHGDPVIWIVIGFILVFLIGQRSHVPKEPSAPEEIQETGDMDAIRVLSILKGILPILEAIAAKLPEIENEILQLKSGFVQLQQGQTTADAGQDDVLAELKARLDKLGGVQ